MDLKEYLKNLEYLVNIDSETKDTDGINKVADFFSKAFSFFGPFLRFVKYYLHLLKKQVAPMGTTVFFIARGR